MWAKTKRNKYLALNISLLHSYHCKMSSLTFRATTTSGCCWCKGKHCNTVILYYCKRRSEVHATRWCLKTSEEETNWDGLGWEGESGGRGFFPEAENNTSSIVEASAGMNYQSNISGMSVFGCLMSHIFGIQFSSTRKCHDSLLFKIFRKHRDTELFNWKLKPEIWAWLSKRFRAAQATTTLSVCVCVGFHACAGVTLQSYGPVALKWTNLSLHKHPGVNGMFTLGMPNWEKAPWEKSHKHFHLPMIPSTGAPDSWGQRTLNWNGLASVSYIYSAKLHNSCTS